MSSNNEKSNNFKKVVAFVDAVNLLASGAGGLAPSSPDIQTQKPNYSIVEQQESEAQKQYESLPKFSKTPEIEEQLEKMADERESKQREKRDKELETSLNEENMAKFSGSPDPESEEGEYVSEYMKDIESRLESGTLTLKSPEEQSESPLRESETESESSESEAESEGEYVSEYMKDIESRLEAGTLTLSSPEEQSESELTESETESESESSESETESESESHSEMKWG